MTDKARMFRRVSSTLPEVEDIMLTFNDLKIGDLFIVTDNIMSRWYPGTLEKVIDGDFYDTGEAMYVDGPKQGRNAFVRPEIEVEKELP